MTDDAEPMSAEDVREERRRYMVGPPLRLNAPLVRALMWGAGYQYDRELAAVLGVSPTRLSRALSGEAAPSARMLDGIARRWPLVPYVRLVVPVGEVDPPERYGLLPEDVTSD